MKIRIISWNVRGANNPEKRKVIKAFLKSQRADVVCIQETKVRAMNRGLVRSLGAGRFLDWGLLMQWEPLVAWWSSGTLESWLWRA